MLSLLAPASARSQESGNLTGRWVLNRNQSQVDKEIGFNPAWLAAGTRSAERESGAGRGRRGSGGGQQGGFAVPRESEEDAKRVQQLSAEARMPSPHLTIIDSRGTVTITDADDVSRTLHTDGNDDYLQIHGLPITAVTVRDSGHVVVRYKVEQGRELRYTDTRETGGPKLKNAGFTVLTNTAEDSYVYVNVITGSLSTGSCVSRFDLTVYTHTTARLSYQPSPVLVQVSLVHRGGLSAGAAAGHSATVVKGVSEYLDEFIARIKAANK